MKFCALSLEHGHRHQGVMRHTGQVVTACEKCFQTFLWLSATSGGSVASHSNRYWCSENLLAVCEVPLCDLEIGSLVCSGGTQNQGAMFLEETSSYYCSVWLVLTPLCRKLREEE